MKLSKYILKGSLLTKLASSLFNNGVTTFSQTNGVGPEEIERLKKFKALTDEKVTEILVLVRISSDFARNYEDEDTKIINYCIGDLKLNNFLD